MELIKDNWNSNDGKEFIRYLETFKNENRISQTKNVLNTKMKVLAIKSPEISMIAKEIKNGNYLSFLDLNLNNYYENTAINGTIISSIKDFNVMRKYLDRYAKSADSWANCDLLKFNIKNNEKEFFNLSKEYSKSESPITRRIGMFVLFKFIDNDDYIDRIYDMLNRFEDEKEYYVNMLNAWLICELFIKRRERTIEFFRNNKLNKFTINKAISKCRDSFRVSAEDKKNLLNFRK